jgi:hypothetical protein
MPSPKTRLLITLFLPLFLLVGFVAHAQMGVIKGKLLLDQSPLGDETIVLKNNEGRIFNGTMTDEFGEFIFRDVPPGTYIVAGKYKDFESEVECTVNPGQEAQISLRCKKKSLFQWIPDGNLNRVNLPVFTLKCNPANPSHPTV